MSSARSAAALRALTDALPRCDALNLGYALTVEGEVVRPTLEQGIRTALEADPLLRGLSVWHSGSAALEELGVKAARHLATPLTFEQPTAAALWSASDSQHLLLFSVHHALADGVVLDRIANDISRSLRGQALELVSNLSSPNITLERRDCSAPPAGSSPFSMRSSCRTVNLPAHATDEFRAVTRSWRSTPFAGAVACAAAAVAACTSQADVAVTIQVAGRNSTAALRAPGPWYDYTTLLVRGIRDTPLRDVLLEASERVVTALTVMRKSPAEREESHCAPLLVVFDAHPLSRLQIPGCRVTPVSVQRHPCRNDGAREYLVATEADIVVFFREQDGQLGISLFTKTSCVPEADAQRLLDGLLRGVQGLCDGGHHPLEVEDTRGEEPPRAARSVVWPEAALSAEPFVDAVSPVFRSRPETLAAFASDARQTLRNWGAPPWQPMF